MNLTAGTPLQNGKYLINHVLGQSRLGLTLQGTQVQLNRPIILKTLKQDIQANNHFALVKQRFIQQASRLARCQHPGLARVIDVFEENGLPFAVMDYTLGQSLAEIVQTHGPLSEAQALHLVQLVGSALTVVHQQGLIHLDVTPRNLICPKGANLVVLVNFGLNHPAVLGLSAGDMEPPAQDYAAIEQYQPQMALTPATDIYSLAATFYYLLTGQVPVAAPQRQTASLIPPRQFAPHLRMATEAAILSGLELNPQSRPQTIATWLFQLPPSESLRSPQPTASNGATAFAKSETITKSEATKSEATPAASITPPPDIASHPKALELSRSAQNLQAQNGQSGNGKSAYPAASMGTPKTDARPNAASLNAIKTNPVKPDVAAPMELRSSAVQSSNRFSKVVVAIAAIAASSGLALGLILRLAAGTTGPGSSLFHTEQAFPPLPNWPSEALPQDPPAAYSAPVPQVVEPQPRTRVVMPVSPPLPRPVPTPKAPVVTASPSPIATPLDSVNPVVPLSPEVPPANTPVEPPLPSPAAVEPSPPAPMEPHSDPLKP